MYRFYYKHGNGKKKGVIDAENAIIYENNSHVPEIVEYTTYTKSKFGLAVDTFLLFNFLVEETRYEVFVPENSVVENYTLDSK